MATPSESAQAIQKALEPHVRPREEAEHIRRILALHLRSCYENGPQTSPLALADSDCIIKSTSEVRGLQREYLKALHANVKAQREYEAASQQGRAHRPAGGTNSGWCNASRLEEHIANIKLRKKQERLQTLGKYLDVLSQKPAAFPEFLQHEEVFKGTRRLPEVPKSVVSSFAVDKSSTKSDLKALVDRLEKAVLRSKLLLKREEQLLEQVKSRSTASPGKISDGAKLSALHATRDELISWMETELGNASAAEDSRPREGEGGREQDKVDKAHMDEQLATVKQKYAQYVAARKTLIQTIGQDSGPSIKPPATAKDDVVELPKPGPEPTDHLITPYIENLLAIAHQQKASITQKSHLGSVLARQREDTGRALDRLAEESQMLPDHPIGAGRREGFGGQAGKPALEITKRVQPWVAAADAAKLATLENVAEKIEDGQVALECSTKHLAEIDQLLGRNQRDEPTEDDNTVDDIWLAETQTPRKGTKSHVRGKSDAVKEPKDIWSALDGNLGLINAEDSPRK